MIFPPAFYIVHRANGELGEGSGEAEARRLNGSPATGNNNAVAGTSSDVGGARPRTRSNDVDSASASPAATSAPSRAGPSGASQPSSRTPNGTASTAAATTASVNESAAVPPTTSLPSSASATTSAGPPAVEEPLPPGLVLFNKD